MVRFKDLKLGKEAAIYIFLIANGIVINILMPRPGIHSDSVYCAMLYEASKVGLAAVS